MKELGIKYVSVRVGNIEKWSQCKKGKRERENHKKKKGAKCKQMEKSHTLNNMKYSNRYVSDEAGIYLFNTVGFIIPFYIIFILYIVQSKKKLFAFHFCFD